MSDETWAVTLELFSHSQSFVTFDDIESGVSVTMSREAFEHAGEPGTIVVLVPGEELSHAAKLGGRVEPVAVAGGAEPGNDGEQ